MLPSDASVTPSSNPPTNGSNSLTKSNISSHSNRQQVNNACTIDNWRYINNESRRLAVTTRAQAAAEASETQRIATPDEEGSAPSNKNPAPAVINATNQDKDKNNELPLTDVILQAYKIDEFA